MINWDRYLKTDKKELQLIQLVKPLYFLNVFLYTVDDFKRDFPVPLVLGGLFIHGLMALVLVGRRRNFNLLGQERLIEKVLPFGSVIIYSLSYYVAQQRGISTRGLPIFLVTFIPIFLYVISISYQVKGFNFLIDRRWIYNYGFLALFVLAYAWVKFGS